MALCLSMKAIDLSLYICINIRRTNTLNQICLYTYLHNLYASKPKHLYYVRRHEKCINE